MNTVLKIDDRDNVITALTDLKKGSSIIVQENTYILLDDIPQKHKFFTQDLQKGDPIFMYGVLVGTAQEHLLAGRLMTTSNTKHAAQAYSYKPHNYQWSPPDATRFSARTFLGYHRPDGSVGTANYWLFIPTVFCENRNLDVIREALHNELGYAITDKYKSFTHRLVQAHNNQTNLEDVDLDTFTSTNSHRLFQNIDGVKFLNHTGGCGGTREDAATLSRLLAAYADHPNVGGVTILSLGCQHLQTNQLREDILARNPKFNKPLLIFEQQQIKSEEQLVIQAIRKTFQAMVELNRIERRPAPLNKLCIGVKCGGSDGFSGISANPAVGYAADLLVALGGKVLLAEFPELCGVEQNIIDRCGDQNSAEKFIRLMKEYDAQAHAVGSGFHMNPSPGNIKDGLITDAIKSAGAAKKAGNAPVAEILNYTEPATRAGLSLVCTPGNDVEATTGQAASGATLILFTTGLGTPTGNPVCPTIKLATNTRLAQQMNDIIDIDCGTVIRGKKTIPGLGEEILEYCIRAASGEVVPKAVKLNQDDFIPWKRGVSL
ncbi:UxaA family hydrolase [Chryseolinea soli]|uniref:Altronate dehydratase n=1 Tax=Chryseolinea soli TaxID=2321403 RepID=A0A385SM80_9BACT|nr:altronate dehydratase family protein [Chryseolinea soli]AYB31942.1 altronate dehydratase [Chryseolinea soli]